MGVKVAVAMSGGVDSSLTAALLLHEGYDVVGVTMKLWENKKTQNKSDRSCSSDTAADDAKAVASMLNIPHHVIDFKDMFQKKVIDYFCREYSFGKTPNPCVACNRYIKFDALLENALLLGAKYVATGHYARIVSDDARGRHLLLKGVDTSKDQSYVLYHLNQHTLGHFMMPLGIYTKSETREMAGKWGLKVADKPESQEICFIPDNDYKAYLKERVPEAFKKGSIVDTCGKILGEHQGVQFFTVGQRKGLGMAFGKPAYVVSINAEKNEVVIGSGDDVFAKSFITDDLNFISIEKLDEPIELDVKIRYAAPAARALVTQLSDGKVRVDFKKPQRAITPGQAAVFYFGEEVVGGGTIFNVL
jgi:tRNA-specific 2-thiouridylase